RFARWRYELTQDYLDIARGIVWRKRIIIPFIRVQNTDTRQGPILRAFALASVTVSTAAGEHAIPGLEAEVAESLRDRAAELARMAQEDV
ncbi:MAG: PH domain-containing protein, partial [Raoultibacter sp.]